MIPGDPIASYSLIGIISLLIIVCSWLLMRSVDKLHKMKAPNKLNPYDEMYNLISVYQVSVS